MLAKSFKYNVIVLYKSRVSLLIILTMKFEYGCENYTVLITVIKMVSGILNIGQFS